MPVLTKEEYRRMRRTVAAEKPPEAEKPKPDLNPPKPRQKPKFEWRMMHPDNVRGAEINATVRMLGRDIIIKAGFVEVSSEEADELERLGWQRGNQIKDWRVGG